MSIGNMKHIKLFESYIGVKVLYHTSCDDFNHFDEGKVAFFSKTKRDSIHFQKNWRPCDDGIILYKCEVEMGKIFNPKKLTKLELNKIEDLVEGTTDKEKLWGAMTDFKELDYPSYTDLEYTLHVLSGTENWQMIELPLFINWLKSNNYDTFIIDEHGFEDESIGVLNISNIKILNKNLIT